MALNYSHRPVLTAHVSDDKLASPLRIVNGYLVECVPEMNGEGYSGLWHGTLGEIDERSINCGRDGVDLCSSSESTSRDIVDLLPSDPFGMDIKTTFTAITGWLEDLEVDYGEYVRSSNVMIGQEEYGLFAGWNLIWNNALKFQTYSSNVQFNENPNFGNWTFPSNFQAYEKPHLGVHSFPSNDRPNEKLNVVNEVDQNGEEKDIGVALAPYDFGNQSVCNVSDIVGYENGSTSYSCEPQFDDKVEGASNFDGVPNEALAFALNYLGVKDLLSVEMVCKFLCSTVRGDPLLWMSIHIDQPLNERITDDVLLHLTNMALGKLQCLSLVECPRITDDGLGRILESNPRLTKLSVPGCTRLSIEGIVHNIKMYNSNKDVGSIKQLRIGGFYGVTHEHYEELKVLLGVDGDKLESPHKPHFYHRGNFYLPHDDDRAIDIEMCPKCEKFKLVYDCPATGCQVKDDTAQVCRACTLCIARCAQCGRCVNDTEYEETFCLELVCSDCFKQLLHYQDRLDEKIDPSIDLDGPSDTSVFIGSG
ncbi:F-box protein SKIP14-like [Primulina eburnea]|uniref:F-box protein SKIP14-like n=1 Tax=Primulina eburnea TaxID=1245227 RepID=UPI003C6C45E5